MVGVRVDKTVKRITKDPRSRAKALGIFDQQWGQYATICLTSGMKITWVRRRPAR
jgi:hypothetical protein